MLLAVISIAALAFWDEERESGAALEDFAEEQAVVASSAAAELSARLSAVRKDANAFAASLAAGAVPSPSVLDPYTRVAVHEAGAGLAGPGGGGVDVEVPLDGGRFVRLEMPPGRLLEGASRIERPSAVRLLLLPPRAGLLYAMDGSVLDGEPIRRALREGASSAWLTRAEAAALGLPARRAAVGLAHVDAGPLGRFGLAVVSTAERERDRELRARYRLVLGVLLAAGLVVAFGSVALAKQRRELLLQRELATTDVKRQGDARLATASRAATMGTLAMGIAHEVSTPLGIIAGRAEQLLPRVAGDERASRGVQAILEEVEHIGQVVRGFLDLARSGAPALADLAPEAVLDRAMRLVEHRFASARVRLVKSVTDPLPHIRGDAQVLAQALVNLLLNACDACEPDGHVEAILRSDGEKVAFTIRDDGVGITPADAARAKEPFFTTKEGARGTGLGLAIAHEIVLLHRGSLEIHPASPHGTTASLLLPAITAAPPQEGPEGPGATGQPAASGGYQSTA